MVYLIIIIIIIIITIIIIMLIMYIFCTTAGDGVSAAGGRGVKVVR